MEIAGKKIDFDKDGFMSDPGLWDNEVARGIATEEGIAELTDKHWAVIRYIRQYWQENDMAPMVRKICQHTGLRLAEIYHLFPMGPAKGACKIAGLPKPDGCV